MLKIILALVISALVSGCATEARISEYQMCAAQGREKFPVNSVPQNYTEIEYFQRQEGMTCTRIPSGFYNAGGMECEPNMRTYQRQVQKTRYVDANAGSRNSWIEQCANQQCIRKFGNSDCEINRNSAPIQATTKTSVAAAEIHFLADMASACRKIGYGYGSQKMDACVAENRAEFSKGNRAIESRFQELISKNRCVEAEVFFKNLRTNNKFQSFQLKNQLDNCKN